MTNFYQTLNDVFVRHAERDCLRFSGGGWSYAELSRQVAGLAEVLCEQGVNPGDRVVAQVEKSPHTLALYLATLRIGGVYVPLNTAYTTAELDYFIEDAQPALFVGSQARGDVPSLTLEIQDDVASGTLIDQQQSVMAATREGAAQIADRQDGDLAAIVYTSGTTGRSKGAMLSHANLASNARHLSEAWGWQDDDVLLHALPIFHVHGLFIASHCALLNGTAMEFMSRFDAQRVSEVLPRCTVMMGVPTFYTRLLALEHFPAQPLSNMRVFICGSAPLTEQVFKAWEARTQHRILERYGMSETIINTTNPLHGERVPATVGYALPGLELRIADDQGHELERGEVGAIEVRGPNVFSGYWRMPEKTAEEVRADGFFITGDLGVQAEDGRVSIVGRSKDLVISGGYNVYPKEIEKIIDDLPGVVESAVIGVPHSDFGEAVVAVVVPQDQALTLADVSVALEDRLARFKQPKHIVNVAELPRNTMGKVQKNRLREQFGDLFAS